MRTEGRTTSIGNELQASTESAVIEKRADWYDWIAQQSCFVIVSGPDRAGKGWLGERLHKELNAHYFSLPKPVHLFDPHVELEEIPRLHEKWLDQWKSDIFAIVRWYQRERHTEKRAVRAVIDRSYPDELVYAKVFRRATYREYEMGMFEAAHKAIKAKLVIVTEHDRHVILDRWKDEGFHVELYWELLERYYDLDKWTALDHVYVNTRENDIVSKVATWAFHDGKKG